jgi:hypothetical protein
LLNRGIMLSMTESTELRRLQRQAEADRQEAADRVAIAAEALHAARENLALHEAELASAEARCKSLAGSIEALEREDRPADLTAMARTDAIVELVRAASSPLSINEVKALLDDHGQDSDYQVVASTLNYLTQTNRLARPTRGRYAMPSAPNAVGTE